MIDFIVCSLLSVLFACARCLQKVAASVDSNLVIQVEQNTSWPVSLNRCIFTINGINEQEME